MTQAQQQLSQLGRDCILARAAKLRQLIKKGYKLSDLCLVQFFGFPSFHISSSVLNDDGSYAVTCDDKFRVEIVRHMSEEEKKEWKLQQKSTGLWSDWRGQKKKKSWEI